MAAVKVDEAAFKAEFKRVMKEEAGLTDAQAQAAADKIGKAVAKAILKAVST